MPSIFKLSYNPQAFRTSLLVTFFAFILDFLFFQLIIPSNVEGINVIVLSILYYLILFLIIRYSIEIYIKLYLEKGVKKVLDELNEEILKDTYDEKDLEKLTLNLIQKARERTSEINVLKDQENYRREFLGNISHELKTPLFTIQGYILTLVEGAMKDKKVREKYLKRAAKGVERLIAIVKDLDLITQFESGIKTVDKSDFNVFDLIDNVFELMEFESEKNTTSLEYDKDYSDPIFVNADHERILQVLTNLVVNSLKYGTENGFTKVSVEEFNNDKIIVKVSDNGEGIDEQHLPRLFERFYRIDKNRSRKKGGSGLGLSIVKHIIEAHQEQIFVKSKLGVGTEFSFTLQKSNFE